MADKVNGFVKRKLLAAALAKDSSKQMPQIPFSLYPLAESNSRNKIKPVLRKKKPNEDQTKLQIQAFFKELWEVCTTGNEIEPVFGKIDEMEQVLKKNLNENVKEDLRFILSELQDMKTEDNKVVPPNLYLFVEELVENKSSEIYDEKSELHALRVAVKSIKNQKLEELKKLEPSKNTLELYCAVLFLMTDFEGFKPVRAFAKFTKNANQAVQDFKSLETKLKTTPKETMFKVKEAFGKVIKKKAYCEGFSELYNLVAASIDYYESLCPQIDSLIPLSPTKAQATPRFGTLESMKIPEEPCELETERKSVLHFQILRVPILAPFIFKDFQTPLETPEALPERVHSTAPQSPRNSVQPQVFESPQKLISETNQEKLCLTYDERESNREIEKIMSSRRTDTSRPKGNTPSMKRNEKKEDPPRRCSSARKVKEWNTYKKNKLLQLENKKKGELLKFKAHKEIQNSFQNFVKNKVKAERKTNFTKEKVVEEFLKTQDMESLHSSCGTIDVTTFREVLNNYFENLAQTEFGMMVRRTKILLEKRIQDKTTPLQLQKMKGQIMKDNERLQKYLSKLNK